MTTAEREASRQRLRAHDEAMKLDDARPRHPLTANALTLCNLCDLDDMHAGCVAGYCSGCCPEH